MDVNKADSSLADMETIVDPDAEKQFDQLERDIDKSDITISKFMSDQGMDNNIALDEEFNDDAANLLTTNEPKKYKVGSVLASGGMGNILDVKDLNCRRNVAMKVMKNPAKIKKKHILRFIVEAQITAQLEHPGIVPVYELSVDASGNVYYTMKRVRGYTLVEILNYIRAEKDDMLEKYSLMRLLTVFNKVCEAVAYAHSKNIIHRDLKPENIMIGDYGEVLLMDWGLAKILDRNSDRNQSEYNEEETIESISSYGKVGNSLKTLAGQVMGTPGFMPPEQALGNISDINTRSDIYALGGILYNILTLKTPISGFNLKIIIKKIVEGDIKVPTSYNSEYYFPHCPNHKVPEPLSAVAMKALSANPKERYQTVEELQNDVEKYLGGFATSVEDAGVFKLLILLLKRQKKEIVLMGIALLAVTSVILGSVIKIVEAKNIAEEHLKKFLYEKNARQEVSRKLLMSAIKTIILMNPDQKRLKYRYSISENEFTLNLHGNKNLTNITSLRELPLTDLDLSNTGISNIHILKDIALRKLNVADTKIADINPISDLQLYSLDISNTDIVDISPLASMTLNELNISGIKLTDLSGLLSLSLRKLTVDSHQMRNIDIFKQLNLEHLGIKNARESDINLLHGLKLTSLELHGKFIKDISQLRILMNLSRLSLCSTKVRDIDIIKKLQLKELRIINGVISDISVIKETEIEVLQLEKCYFLSDLFPIIECQSLRKLQIPSHIMDVDYLKTLSNLQVLAYNEKNFNKNQSVEEFWKKNSKPKLQEPTNE